MLSRAEQATVNLEDARRLRADGATYRAIRRQLGITAAQLGLIRRTLKREKAGATRLRGQNPAASDRDLRIARSALPAGLRKRLIAAGHVTLGDLADRLADPALPDLQALDGIGPHKAALVRRLLDQFGLLAGSDDLRADVEALFPDLADHG